MTLQLCCFLAFPENLSRKPRRCSSSCCLSHPFSISFPSPSRRAPGAGGSSCRLFGSGAARASRPSLPRAVLPSLLGRERDREALRRPKCLQMCGCIGLGSQRRAKPGEGVSLSRAVAALGQNHLGSKRLLRSSSTTCDPTGACQLDHRTKCHVQALLQLLQGR